MENMGEGLRMYDDQENPAAFLPLLPAPFVSFADPLPSLPTMISTRLQLELLLKDSLIDLKAVSEVILADAGATLQVLRLIGEEYPSADGRPTRIEDCIVSLSTERCYQLICTSETSGSDAYVSEWQLCRRIAECARELAESLDGFSPEEAYLVGLLYRLGSFPHLLGWKVDGSSASEHEALGVMLAYHWHLPDYVLYAIKEHQAQVIAPRWRSMLQLAHQLAKHSSS